MADQLPAGLPPEFDETFTGDGVEVPDDLLRDPTKNPLSNRNGLADWQRTIVKVIYDRDKDGRRGFMKRLGYELDASGDKYRPVDTDTNFVDIDPDNTTAFGLLPWYEFIDKGVAETGKELWRDAKDVAADMLIVGPLMTSVGVPAAKAGALTAGAAAAPLGPIASGIAAFGGGIVAGAAAAGGAYALTETTKKAIGVALLDDDVPLNKLQLLYDSAVAGTTFAVMNKGGEAVQQMRKAKVERKAKNLQTLVTRHSEQEITPELAADMLKHPEKYSPENLKGAQDKLLDFQNHLFGTSVANPKSTRQLTGGILRDKMTKLNSQFDAELEKLSQIDEANFTVDELTNLIKTKAEPLARLTFRSPAEEKTLAFLNSQLKTIRDKARVGDAVADEVDSLGNVIARGAPEKFREYTFKEGRKLLKDIQDHVFDGDEQGQAAAVLKSVAGEFRQMADDKAFAIRTPEMPNGSVLPLINKKRSRALTLYNGLRQVTTDGTLQAAYLGKSKNAKLRFQRGLEAIDQEFDTNLAEGARQAQFDAAVERFFDNPTKWGEDAFLAEALRGGLQQAPKRAFGFGVMGQALKLPLKAMGVPVDGVVDTMAAAGAGYGFAQGANKSLLLRSPDALMNEMSKVRVRLDDLAKNPTLLQRIRQAYTSPAGQLGAQSDLLPTELMPLRPESQPHQVQPPLAPPAEAQPPQAAALPPEFDETFPDLSGE